MSTPIDNKSYPGNPMGKKREKRRTNQFRESTVTVWAFEVPVQSGQSERPTRRSVSSETFKAAQDIAAIIT